MEEQEFTFQGKKYKLRQLSFDEDLSIQEQCVDPQTGQLNVRKFNKIRIAKCLVEPKMLIDDIGLFPAAVGNFLASCVSIINDGFIFKEDLKKNQEAGNSTSS